MRIQFQKLDKGGAVISEEVEERHDAPAEWRGYGSMRRWSAADRVIVDGAVRKSRFAPPTLAPGPVLFLDWEG